MSLTSLKLEDLPHYTYEDYARWEGKWELIKGIPFAMTPSPVIEHQRLITKIIRYLGELLDECSGCEALLPVDWQITEDTVVQPDVLVVCHENEDIGIVKLEKTPVMVFEVLSPSTARKDRVVKYQLYENAGVKYYCILDPDAGSAQVFTLEKEKFGKGEEFNNGLMEFDFGPCQIKFDFGRIFFK